MQRIDLKSLFIVALAVCAGGCGKQDSQPPAASGSPHVTSDGTEEVMLDAKVTLSPSERSQLAQAISAGSGSVHVAEEAGKLKIFRGEASPEKRTESTVVLGNHSEASKPPVRVKVTPEALAVMRAREKQGGTTDP